MSELQIECLTGTDLVADLPALARLRIRVFRDYPYLYEGDAEYEERYLRTYADAPDGVMVLVRDGDRVVGASSALPLAAETPNLIEPFRAHDYAPERVFYYGESVLLPEYRGLGLGRRFFEEREAHARALGRFNVACFCAVERPDDHPRRPRDYRPLDGLWAKQGFVRQPQLRTTFSWRDLDDAVETPKPMVFWLKHLD
ncbi:GNAT family N-acetyltransferase [Thiocapsa sp.]|uniref:GNAT family N-acetyltransferase n=1 Tax=Thiocapsa sp. TaxID=2024551 RepID=UPI002C3FABFE|nr:GNAT family N-acetyltransferase [Thiocapsa sp.]HSO83783.1 GNAT family N-acetyltransferase [Thiocapsa sp.]